MTESAGGSVGTRVKPGWQARIFVADDDLEMVVIEQGTFEWQGHGVAGLIQHKRTRGPHAVLRIEPDGLGRL